MQTLMSPRRRMPSEVVLWTPLRSIRRMPRLTSWWPNVEGAMESASLSYNFDMPFIIRISSFSSSVNSIATSCAVLGLSLASAPMLKSQLSLTWPSSLNTLSSPRRRTRSATSDGNTQHATKQVRYVNSLTPNAAKPRMPPPPPEAASLPALKFPVLAVALAASPARANALPSGTTTKLPVNTTRSPALARSTISFRTTTSIVRGMEPGGISSAFSWTRRRCQSTNSLPPLLAASSPVPPVPEISRLKSLELRF
mmetsp:Transcript_26694/g.48127  ORF Transcript_26694/g.48127 Transcript_26694/m.48127 type:complete len:254 (+) Transcript_26694:1531-2292(+)